MGPVIEWVITLRYLQQNLSEERKAKWDSLCQRLESCMGFVENAAISNQTVLQESFVAVQQQESLIAKVDCVFVFTSGLVHVHPCTDVPVSSCCNLCV